MRRNSPRKAKPPARGGLHYMADCKQLLRMGRRRGIVSAALTLAHALLHAGLHGFELLLLLIVQYGFDFGVRVGADLLRLRAAVVARERVIVEERLHLLLTRFENGLDLRLLIGREVQRFGQVLQMRIGIHAAVMAPVSLLLRWIGFLRIDCGGGAKRQDSAECHDYDFASHTAFLPVVSVEPAFSEAVAPVFCVEPTWLQGIGFRSSYRDRRARAKARCSVAQIFSASLKARPRCAAASARARSGVRNGADWAHAPRRPADTHRRRWPGNRPRRGSCTSDNWADTRWHRCAASVQSTGAHRAPGRRGTA